MNEDRSESRPAKGDSPASEHRPRRRGFLRTAGIATAGVAAGAVVGGASGAIASSGDRHRTLVFEAAMLGSTDRAYVSVALLPDAGFELDEGDLSGSPFYIEGFLYPDGTVPADGFVPTPDGSIGIMTCRGHLISSLRRGEPHLVTSHEYFLDGFGDEVLNPRLLTSAGAEGRNEVGWEALRAITGGTGEFSGARGQVHQRMFGVNSTINSVQQNMPNFRFELDIHLP